MNGLFIKVWGGHRDPTDAATSQDWYQRGCYHHSEVRGATQPLDSDGEGVIEA